MPLRFRTANIYNVVFAIGDPVKSLKIRSYSNTGSASVKNLQISERLPEYDTTWRAIPGVAHAHSQNAGTTASTVHGAERATVSNTEHSRVAWLGGKR